MIEAEEMQPAVAGDGVADTGTVPLPLAISNDDELAKLYYFYFYRNDDDLVPFIQVAQHALIRLLRQAKKAKKAKKEAVTAEDPLVLKCKSTGCLPKEIETEAQLLAMGGGVLQAACATLGLKAGGTLELRAQRLMATKGKRREEWPASLLTVKKEKASLLTSRRRRRR